MTAPTGGPAFPSPNEKGMTMRDYFAAAALPAIIEGTMPHSLHLPREAAQLAYAQADAMLQERAK